MNFDALTEEQRFVLRHVARLDTLVQDPKFAAVDGDLIDAILEGAAQFAAGEWAPLNRVGDTSPPQWRDGVVTMPPGFRDAYAAFVEGGWGTLGAPVAYGGQGLPASLATAVTEALGTANLAFNLGPMLTLGAIDALVHHGSEELRSAYLSELVSGRWMGTMNLTEPHAGSDVGALTSLATPVGDGRWHVKGTKIFITYGEHDLTDNIVHLVLARTPGAPAGSKGISLFLVPKVKPDGTANDLRCVSIEHKLGIHGSPTCVMSFGDHDGCEGWLIGSEHGGLRAMFTMMNNARINVGLQGVEIAERARQQAFAYARERVQSVRAGAAGKGPVAIIDHPDVRRMLMRMTAQTQAARALAYAAFAQVDRLHADHDGAQSRLDLLTPLVKAHCTDIGCEVSSLGVQVHGGMGFVEETGAAQHYRDARILPIYEGTNGIQAADLVGRKLAGDGGRALQALATEILDEAEDPRLHDLVAEVVRLGGQLLTATIDDRLAASVPYLTMVSVMTCGWLMERQGRAAAAQPGFARDSFLLEKHAVAKWYVAHMVPEALGLAASVELGADELYRVWNVEEAV